MKNMLIVVVLFAVSLAMAQTGERPRQRIGPGQGVAGTISERPTASH